LTAVAFSEAYTDGKRILPSAERSAVIYTIFNRLYWNSGIRIVNRNKMTYPDRAVAVSKMLMLDYDGVATDNFIDFFKLEDKNPNLYGKLFQETAIAATQFIKYFANNMLNKNYPLAKVCFFAKDYMPYEDVTKEVAKVLSSTGPFFHKFYRLDTLRSNRLSKENVKAVFRLNRKMFGVE